MSAPRNVVVGAASASQSRLQRATAARSSSANRSGARAARDPGNPVHRVPGMSPSRRQHTCRPRGPASRPSSSVTAPSRSTVATSGSRPPLRREQKASSVASCAWSKARVLTARAHALEFAHEQDRARVGRGVRKALVGETPSPAASGSVEEGDRARWSIHQRTWRPLPASARLGRERASARLQRDASVRAPLVQDHGDQHAGAVVDRHRREAVAVDRHVDFDPRGRQELLRLRAAAQRPRPRNQPSIALHEGARGETAHLVGVLRRSADRQVLCCWRRCSSGNASRWCVRS